MRQKLFVALAMVLFFANISPRAEMQISEDTSNHNITRSSDTSQKEKIHDVVAGQPIRQGKAELHFTNQLQSMKILSSAHAHEAARKAYEASKAASMKELEYTYHDNILAQVKQEMRSYGHDFDAEYIKKLTTQNQESDLYDDTHLYVFISESIPEATLDNYLTALEKVNVSYVLRGVIGNNVKNFMPTQHWVQKVLCREKSLSTKTQCRFGPIDINPNLYRAFNIQEVPALVYVKEPQNILTCGEKTLTDKDFLVWYGDTNPEYVLKMFARNTPNDSTLLKIISTLQGTIWANEKGENE